MSTYQFLPWARSGLTTLIQTPPLGRDDIAPNTPGQVTLPTTIKLNGTAVGMPTGVKPPRFYGPGDVIGIEAREVIRTGPLDLTPDYQPERFAFVEFDHPDFPWLLTPGSPDPKECLRPWLVLIVVEKSQATITPPTGKSLPILSCPLKELPPNLNESWAWAHAVYAGAAGLDKKSVESELGKNPERNLSRLLCARKLAPHIAYEACMVPAFEAGRKAGVGLPFDSDEPLKHWSFATDAEVKLPVYYHWSFSTGAENLFIKLAKQLQSLKDEIPSDIAGEMDLTELGVGMRQYKLPIPSALQITPLPPETPRQVKDRMRVLLLEPEETALPLPVYGSWHAPPGTPPQQLDGHKWLNLLNLDPRYRVAAALGTSVVQKEQDHLIAVAWEQVGDLQRANELLQRKQLACCVTESIHKKRFGILSPSVFSQLVEPLPSTENDGISSTRLRFRTLRQDRVMGKEVGSDGSVSRKGRHVSPIQGSSEPLNSFAEAVIADHPVAYYRLNESSGSTTALDWSGNNNHSALIEGGVILGVPGLGPDDTAAQFDGATGRIVVINSESLNPTRITMEAVFRWDGPVELNQRILQKGHDAAVQYGLVIKSDGHVRVGFGMRMLSSPKPTIADSTSVIERGTITHVVATYDGLAFRIYLNGILDRTVLIDPPEVDIDVNWPHDLPNDPSVTLTIGGGFTSVPPGRRTFNGLIDDVAIYNKALSTDQIRLHALAVPPTKLEHVAATPPFRRVTRPRRSWALKGSVNQYPLEQIAPPPGVTNDVSKISGNTPPQPFTQASMSAGREASSIHKQDLLDETKPQPVMPDGAEQKGGAKVTKSVPLSNTPSGPNLAELRKEALLDRTDPQKTFRQDVASRVTIPKDSGLRAAGTSEDRFHQHGPLGLYTYTPKFSHPMYELLRDQFPNMLLPGLEKIPNDRVALLKPNPSFIEAYMVGLNHEMSREFLWREFPTMMNVTYFSRFWDARSAANPEKPDFPPIDQWADNELGSNLAPDRGGNLTFLLIRGELIVRYPNALIYARKKGSSSDVDLKLPVLRFSPITGVALIGFNLDGQDVSQWIFFVEEHFTEPYLGPGQDADIPQDSPYVSFAKQQGNNFRYKNSAAVAEWSLQKRFYMELPVPAEGAEG